MEIVVYDQETGITWYDLTDVKIGVKWNREVEDDNIFIAPTIYRYDAKETNNSTSKFKEVLSVDSKDELSKSNIQWGSGSGIRQVDKLERRVYQRREYEYVVSLTISWDATLSTYNDGWKAKGAGSHTWSTAINQLDSNTVAYQPNGGDINTQPLTQTKWHGVPLTLSSIVPTRKGYTFINWDVNKTPRGGATYNPGDIYNEDSALILYAQWHPDTYKISYEKNGGSSVPENQWKIYDEDLTLSYSIPFRKGHTFKGWGTSENATDIAYRAGSVYTANAPITLYAIWEKNTLEISYDANGGNGIPNNQTKTYGESLTLSSVKPTMDGFIFDSWNTNEFGTGDSYKAKSVLKDDSYIEDTSKKIKLYAKWNRNHYSIVFDANEGENAPSSQEKYYDMAMKITGDNPTKSGHTFLGWSDSPSGSVLYPSGGIYPSYLNEDAILYAVWELNAIPPTFSDLKAVRCVEDGTEDYSGTYAKVTGSCHLPEDIDSIDLLIQYMSENDVEWSYGQPCTINKESDESFSEILDFNMLTDKTYYVRIITLDDSGNKRMIFQTVLPSSFRTMDFGNEGKTVAVGRTASDQDGFEVGLPARFYNGAEVNTLNADDAAIKTANIGDLSAGTLNASGAVKFNSTLEVDGITKLNNRVNIGELYVDPNSDGNGWRKVNFGTPLLDGTNLNDIKDLGMYCRRNNSAKITNLPAEIGTDNFNLEVMLGSGDGTVIQKITNAHKTRQYVAQRSFYSGSWGDWEAKMFRGQNVLWQGQMYMLDTQTITLSEKVTEQDTGIALVWSRYMPATDTTQDSDFCIQFVPKKQVELFPGKGVCCFCATAALGGFAMKYVYISDKSIKGYKNNTTTGTASGISYDNANFVLRYVVGC